MRSRDLLAMCKCQYSTSGERRKLLLSCSNPGRAMCELSHAPDQPGDQSAATASASSRPCARPARAEDCRVTGSCGFGLIAVADAASGAIGNLGPNQRSTGGTYPPLPLCCLNQWEGFAYSLEVRADEPISFAYVHGHYLWARNERAQRGKSRQTAQVWRAFGRDREQRASRYRRYRWKAKAS